MDSKTKNLLVSKSLKNSKKVKEMKEMKETDEHENSNEQEISDEMEGGVRRAVKTPKFTMQSEINKDLLKNISISAFVQNSVNAKVKNTVGIHCKKCGSDNINSESRQTRSADEATTIIFTCLNCGQVWRMN